MHQNVHQNGRKGLGGLPPDYACFPVKTCDYAPERRVMRAIPPLASSPNRGFSWRQQPSASCGKLPANRIWAHIASEEGPRNRSRQTDPSSSNSQRRLPTYEVPGPFQRFRTNNFPGSCRIIRFISKPSRATDTAEDGNPLRRMTSSMALSSFERVS